ncbi:5'-methylthioadenosine/S-adenosylhomocysteine nucleosidase family protein [Mycoplasma struthionis]|uniref:5'-methylthioadenosine/S-adenosylhomocysteine nucleosidase n=1 Tax=Mycoplasma struthionis TaxID=538220 RepID=A0A3G8LH32_9MOLU|nr:5'-methylthioadenosine/S-adenosylhomocysteine nucleosidase [Mycoplasma struthionis]AZG68644.1 hypothetical protein EGN60_01515 [Mycoplasma struthionis]TPI02299.1 5'-methylthioadenosine/S-adenosylhomocysteine nucleosidase [Mycoplasma struthionis]
MKLFIFAEEWETEKLRNELNIKNKISLNINNNYQSLYMYKENVLLAHSGVGKSNAASFLSFLIAKYPIDIIINIGPAASINKREIGEIIEVNKTCFYDVDLTFLKGYNLGKLPYIETYFETKNKIDKKEITLASADQFAFLKHRDFLLTNFENVEVVDMEGASYNLVAQNFNIDFYCYKIVSDNLLSNSNVEYLEAKKIWENKIIEVFKKIGN